MNEARIAQRELFDQLPPEWPEDLLPAIQEKIRQARRKVVVLDDDPTGTQTVHDVPVLTSWTIRQLSAELRGPAPAFYLLTNSRSLTGPEAEELNQMIGENLRQAGHLSGQEFVTISRSDSTLRGHFPGEVAALAGGLEEEFDAWLIIPCFPEGGRFTIQDVHYVAEGEWLTPAGQTEFARDKSFGYQSSNLREWVAEKTGGAVPAERIFSISLEDLRGAGPQAVTSQLLRLPKGAVCVVNAVSYRDLEVFVLGLLGAEDSGRRYIYRTAASFVRIRAGISPRPLLTRADLDLPAAGAGLVIAGSYVPRTSAQLEALIQQSAMHPVEVRVSRLLEPAERSSEIERARQAVNQHLSAGEDTVIFTSRNLVSAQENGAHANLQIGKSISDGLVEIVRGLQTRPRFLLAKGGITSSDIATGGLGIQRAIVLGQVLPGVPAWRCGPESRYPGLTYIVFPGNVGGPDALVNMTQGLFAA